MKLISSLVAVVGLAVVAPAFAAPVTLTFEDQTSFSSLDYSESAWGFSANGALLALANDGLGSGANGEYFSNNPSGTTVMFATTPLPGELAALTSTLGFTGSAQFQYSASATGTVYARDAGGAVIGSLLLNANSTDAINPFNYWSLGTLAFAGVAYSIDFSEVAGIAAFDDVTVNPVPLPAAALLFPAALAAFGLRRRKIAA